MTDMTTERTVEATGVAAAAEAEVMTAGELTDTERARLLELESVVGASLAHFIRAGLALAEIRDRELYRATHGTFEAYVKDRWDIAGSTAYQYIGGAQVVRRIEMSAIADKPTVLPVNEGQVRPLCRVPADEQAAVWLAALYRAPDGRVTGRIVADAVREHLGEQARERAERLQDDAAHDPELPAAFKELFWKFTELIREIRGSIRTEKQRAAMQRHLDGLRALLAE